jgi:hypothetical protein
VGFGSMVIRDCTALADIIMQAAQNTGQRVLVQSNWSKISVGESPLCFDVGPCRQREPNPNSPGPARPAC